MYIFIGKKSRNRKYINIFIVNFIEIIIIMCYITQLLFFLCIYLFKII